MTETVVDFYTNVSVNRNSIFVIGYRNGERYQSIVPYKPYLFLPSKEKTEYKDIYGNNVALMSFSTIREARDFVKRYDDVENFNIYGLDHFQYPYIFDNFKGQIEYDKSLIRVYNIDIETANEHGGFPNIETANEKITLLGVGVGKERIIFGWGEYKPTDDRVQFIECANEHDMLVRFLMFWEEKCPDVITGWNVEKFDIPYIVNRIRRILGAKEILRLSPWGVIREKEIESRGRTFQTYVPLGISILDYYDLYRKFTYTQLESYTLDHVAFVETGKRKLDYSEYDSLFDLYKNDYTKFVNYNITDIDRVSDIDDKNKFIDLVLAIAYDAKVNFTDALTSVRLWDVIIHNHLLEKNVVVPRTKEKNFVDIPGGYVKDPKVGMNKWVVSFDLESLYPHLIKQYNISPETIVDFDENWTLDKFNALLNVETDLSALKTENTALAANGAKFRRDIHGFLPELMTKQFDLRKKFKNEMLALKKKNDSTLENKIAALHNLQMAKKIQLNSLYGSLANQYFRFYDYRLSSAITISGQLSVQWVERALNKFFNKVLATQDVDYIVAIDTDSCYVNFHPLLAMMGVLDRPTPKIVDLVNKIAEEQIQPVINAAYKQLARYLNAYENAMRMKREAISDKSIWVAKKRYIMNIWDNEGVRYAEPQLKMMGNEAIRSTTPAVCKQAIKDVIKLIMTKDNDAVIKFISEFKRKFQSLPFEDVASPSGINGLTKYIDKASLFKSGTPIHVRGAIIYNKLLSDMDLEHKYSRIFDSDKIKFCYLRLPNRAFSDVIAVQRNLPKEFGLHEVIDYETQFEKKFLKPVEAILDIIGWTSKRTNTLEAFIE